MQRARQQPRPDWPGRLDEIGFRFHSIDEHGVMQTPDPHRFPYWVENAAYLFSEDEIEAVWAATRELHARCLDAVDYVIRARLFSRMAIPPEFEPLIRASWERRDPSVYGRFDMTLDERGVPKMYEYNADTPTSLIESSIAQWFWKTDVQPDHDQFNSIHEALVDRWRALRRHYPDVQTLHFACIFDSLEDVANVEYLMDTAVQAGWAVKILDMGRIGVDRVDRFFDEQDEPVDLMFKLYPWEWMLRESFGPRLIASPTRWIEPPWKMILSNKAILAVLWTLFPDHPNLLPASLSKDDFAGKAHARKPFFSREGANVSLTLSDGQTIAEGGRYGEEGFVYQAYAPLPRFGDRYATIGSWVVGDESVGLCVREELQPITRNTSFFVPHYFNKNDRT
ncbi:glutathionylspermidine synthase family protein [Paraburkholderia acidipaludis]|uniref:glutathionylspermidine synthase family protein n=1 Tax=Paraburkholderia acidipaludis TaxID=660537 RepID=UPI00048236D6|nr:glutathionylspermidine synthase family protein [Paraburkholderia acidipaludis]